MSDVEIAKRSTRGSLILFGGNFLSTVIIAISAIVIARLLGPDAYGAYTLALLLPNILLGLVGLGVAVGVTRFAAQHLAQGERSVAQRMTWNGIFFLLIFGGLLTIVSFLGSGYVSAAILHRPALTSLVEFASLAVFSQGIIQSVTSSLLGWNAMRSISVINVSQALLKFFIATTLVILGYGVFGAVLGLITSYFAAGGIAIFALYSVTKGNGISVWGFGEFLRDNFTMLRYGFPHHAGSLVYALSLQYVTVVLAVVATNVVVGFYQSAANVLSAVSLTSSAVTLTLFPAFTHLEGIKADIPLAFRYAVKYSSFLIGPLILFLIGASRPIMQVLYGPSFSSADIYLVLLCLSNLPILLGLHILPSFFSGVGKTRLSMYFFFLEAGLLFALAPLLGIWLDLGVPGLIYSILLSNLGAAGLGLYLGRRALRVGIDAKALVSILLASIIAFGAILPIQILNASPYGLLVADIAVFSFVYLTTAPLIGAINQDDLVRLSIATSGLGFYSDAFSSILRYEKKILDFRLAR